MTMQEAVMEQHLHPKADGQVHRNLAEAIHAVQEAAPRVKRDSTGQTGNRNYRYASLETVADEVRPLLAEHELNWQTFPSVLDGHPSLKYRLKHVPTGDADQGEMLQMLAQMDPQGQGSAITYARRYALICVLDLIVEDDDDDGARGAAQDGSRGRTVNLHEEAKGLNDGQINQALQSVGLPIADKPWGAMAKVPAAKASELRAALDAARALG